MPIRENTKLKRMDPRNERMNMIVRLKLEVRF